MDLLRPIPDDHPMYGPRPSRALTLEEHNERAARKRIRTALGLMRGVLRREVRRTGEETKLLHIITTYLETGKVG
jgi:hypothetical protein